MSSPTSRAPPGSATRSPTPSASAVRTSRWSWPGSRCDLLSLRRQARAHILTSSTLTNLPNSMRALTIVADRRLELVELAPPPPPAAGEVQIRVRAVALNHIDVWGWRGMAFAKRKLPLVVGAEAAGEITAIGPDVGAFKPGDAVVMYGGL